MDIRTTLLTAFINNGANINLIDYLKKITVLSEAINLHDKELIKLLLKKGADIGMLTEEQKTDMDNIMKEPILEPISTQVITSNPIITSKPAPILEQVITSTQVISSKPVIKLNILMNLPSDSGYDTEVEPEFWRPIFEENEMFTIRKLINNIMISDGKIPLTKNEVTSLWSIC